MIRRDFRHYLRSLGVPVATSIVAMGLRTLLQPWLGMHELFILALPAVAITHWIAGLRPALLCGLLCLLWMVEPLSAEPLGDVAARLAVLSAAVAGVCVLVEYVRRYVQGLDAKASAAENAALVARLSLAENRFSRMAATSPNVIFVYDMVTRQNVYVNKRFSDLLGLDQPPDDRMGSRIGELAHPDDTENVRLAHERLRTAPDDEVVEYEVRFRHSDGHWVWFRQRSTVFTRLPDGRAHEILGNGEDITAARAAERALAESERRFQRMAETIADVLYIFDLRTRGTVYINTRAFAILGYTPDEVHAMGAAVIPQLVHPDDRARVIERVRHFRTLADGQVLEIEYRLRHADGRFLWVSSRETVFLRDPEGKPVQILGTTEDITEIRANREALLLAAKRKDEFLAMLAHELRNPLAPIRNAAQVIKLVDQSGSPRLQWAREVIERQSAHMARLVDDLLDVSRTTTGKITLRREPVEISTLVQRAIELGRPLIESRHQVLETVVNDATTVLNVDPARITQVIGNLLNNASKYSEEGAPVRLRVRAIDGWAEIAVTDSGIGITPEFLPHVFDLFSQGTHSLDRAQGGLGIGLTLVKTLVELHGGSVTALSAGLGKGSTFVVRLPVAAVAASPLKSEVPQGARAPLSGRRVLIVDDNIDSAEMLRVIVEAHGFTTAIRYDGISGLATCESFNPDVVILDLGLPGLNGYEVGARIRARAGVQPVLIALTGYGQPEDYDRTRAHGFDHHLVKPTEPEAVTALLASVAGRTPPEAGEPSHPGSDAGPRSGPKDGDAPTREEDATEPFDPITGR